MFFQSSYVQFWWPYVNRSLSFLFLPDKIGNWCGLLLLQSICFNMLCIQRGSLAYLGCTESFFFLISAAFLSVPKMTGHSHLCISVQRSDSHWIFSLFRTSSLNPGDGCAGKFKKFVKYWDQPICHQQPCYIQSSLIQLSSQFWYLV